MKAKEAKVENLGSRSEVSASYLTGSGGGEALERGWVLFEEEGEQECAR